MAMNRHRYCLRSICSAEFVDDRANMRIDGALRRAQDFPDLPRRLAPSYPIEDFHFPRRERGVAAACHPSALLGMRPSVVKLPLT